MNKEDMKNRLKSAENKIADSVKKIAGKKENKETSYISAKESAKISRQNRRITSKIEKQRNRKHIPESDYTTTMRDPNNVVEFDNLHTYFFTDIGTVKAVDGVTFDIPQGKTVGVVGESGCGKSVTSLSLMQLVQRPQGQTVEGQIRFNFDETKAYDIAKTPTKVMQTIRGNKISMIFQEPMTSLNPVFRIGAQVDEVLLLHQTEMSKEEVKDKTISLLEMVGIANSEGVYKMYPHELSGGMRQRVMIAMALACNPKLIIADEPTTALDVTIQAQILDLLRTIKDKTNSSIMLITHDLGVIAEMADFIVVMYAGRVVEKGTAEDIFEHPSHPYTLGLMRSKPVVGKKVERLYNIPGNVPNPINMPNYCYFKDRCEQCVDVCAGDYPPMVQLSPTHFVSCYRYKETEHNFDDNGVTAESATAEKAAVADAVEKIEDVILTDVKAAVTEKEEKEVAAEEKKNNDEEIFDDEALVEEKVDGTVDDILEKYDWQGHDDGGAR